MQVFVLASLVIAILAVIFALQNNAPTTVSFLAWKFHGSLALTILLATAAGSLISFFASLPTLLRMKWHLRAHRRRLAEMEAARTGQPRPPPAGQGAPPPGSGK